MNLRRSSREQRKTCKKVRNVIPGRLCFPCSVQRGLKIINLQDCLNAAYDSLFQTSLARESFSLRRPNSFSWINVCWQLNPRDSLWVGSVIVSISSLSGSSGPPFIVFFNFIVVHLAITFCLFLYHFNLAKLYDSWLQNYLFLYITQLGPLFQRRLPIVNLAWLHCYFPRCSMRYSEYNWWGLLCISFCLQCKDVQWMHNRRQPLETLVC